MNILAACWLLAIYTWKICIYVESTLMKDRDKQLYSDAYRRTLSLEDEDLSLRDFSDKYSFDNEGNEIPHTVHRTMRKFSDLWKGKKKDVTQTASNYWDNDWDHEYTQPNHFGSFSQNSRNKAEPQGDLLTRQIRRNHKDYDDEDESTRPIIYDQKKTLKQDEPQEDWLAKQKRQMQMDWSEDQLHTPIEKHRNPTSPDVKKTSLAENQEPPNANKEDLALDVEEFLTRQRRRNQMDYDDKDESTTQITHGQEELLKREQSQEDMLSKQKIKMQMDWGEDQLHTQFERHQNATSPDVKKTPLAENQKPTTANNEDQALAEGDLLTTQIPRKQMDYDDEDKSSTPIIHDQGKPIKGDQPQEDWLIPRKYQEPLTSNKEDKALIDDISPAAGVEHVENSFKWGRGTNNFPNHLTNDNHKPINFNEKHFSPVDGEKSPSDQDLSTEANEKDENRLMEHFTGKKQSQVYQSTSSFTDEPETSLDVNNKTLPKDDQNYLTSFKHQALWNEPTIENNQKTQKMQSEGDSESTFKDKQIDSLVDGKKQALETNQYKVPDGDQRLSSHDIQNHFIKKETDTETVDEYVTPAVNEEHSFSYYGDKTPTQDQKPLPDGPKLSIVNKNNPESLQDQITQSSSEPDYAFNSKQETSKDIKPLFDHNQKYSVQTTEVRRESPAENRSRPRPVRRSHPDEVNDVNWNKLLENDQQVSHRKPEIDGEKQSLSLETTQNTNFAINQEPTDHKNNKVEFADIVNSASGNDQKPPSLSPYENKKPDLSDNETPTSGEDIKPPSVGEQNPIGVDDQTFPVNNKDKLAPMVDKTQSLGNEVNQNLGEDIKKVSSQAHFPIHTNTIGEGTKSNSIENKIRTTPSWSSENKKNNQLNALTQEGKGNTIGAKSTLDQGRTIEGGNKQQVAPTKIADTDNLVLVNHNKTASEDEDHQEKKHNHGRVEDLKSNSVESIAAIAINQDTQPSNKPTLETQYNYNKLTDIKKLKQDPGNEKTEISENDQNVPYAWDKKQEPVTEETLPPLLVQQTPPMDTRKLRTPPLSTNTGEMQDTPLESKIRPRPSRRPRLNVDIQNQQDKLIVNKVESTNLQSKLVIAQPNDDAFKVEHGVIPDATTDESMSSTKAGDVLPEMQMSGSKSSPIQESHYLEGEQQMSNMDKNSVISNKDSTLITDDTLLKHVKPKTDRLSSVHDNNPSTEEYNDSSELNSNLKYEFISHEFKLPHPHIRPGKALSLQNDEDNQEINSLSMLEPTAGQPRPPRVSHRKTEQHPRRNQLNTENSSITDDMNSYLNNNQGVDSSGHSKQIRPAQRVSDDSSKQESKTFIEKVKGFFTFGKKSKPTIEPREKTRQSPMRPSRNNQKTSTERLNQLPERPVHRKPEQSEGININERRSSQNHPRPHRPQRHESNRPATVQSPVDKGIDRQKSRSGFFRSLGTFFHSENKNEDLSSGEISKDSKEGIGDRINEKLQISPLTTFPERQSQTRHGTNSVVKPERKARTEVNPTSIENIIPLFNHNKGPSITTTEVTRENPAENRSRPRPVRRKRPDEKNNMDCNTIPANDQQVSHSKPDIDGEKQSASLDKPPINNFEINQEPTPHQDNNNKLEAIENSAFHNDQKPPTSSQNKNKLLDIINKEISTTGEDLIPSSVNKQNPLGVAAYAVNVDRPPSNKPTLETQYHYNKQTDIKKLKQEPGIEKTEISEYDQNVPSVWDKKQEPVTEQTLTPLLVQQTPPMDTRKLRTPPLSTNTGEMQDTPLESKIRPRPSRRPRLNVDIQNQQDKVIVNKVESTNLQSKLVTAQPNENAFKVQHGVIPDVTTDESMSSTKAGEVLPKMQNSGSKSNLIKESDYLEGEQQMSNMDKKAVISNKDSTFITTDDPLLKHVKPKTDRLSSVHDNNPSTEEYNDSSEVNSNLKYEFSSHEFKLPHPHIRPGKALSLENDEDNQEINSLSMLEPTAGQPRPPRVSHRKPEQHPRRNQLNTETSSITDDINSYLNNNQGDDSSGHSKQILPADDSSKQESKDFIQKVKGFFTFGKKSKPTIEPREKTRQSPMRPSRNNQKTSTERLNQLPERPVHRKPELSEGININERRSSQNYPRPHRPQRHESNRPATVHFPVDKGIDAQKSRSGFFRSLGTFFHSENKNEDLSSGEISKDSKEGIGDRIKKTLQISPLTTFPERQSLTRHGTNSVVKPERKARTEVNPTSIENIVPLFNHNKGPSITTTEVTRENPAENRSRPRPVRRKRPDVKNNIDCNTIPANDQQVSHSKPDIDGEKQLASLDKPPINNFEINQEPTPHQDNNNKLEAIENSAFDNDQKPPTSSQNENKLLDTINNEISTTGEDLIPSSVNKQNPLGVAAYAVNVDRPYSNKPTLETQYYYNKQTDIKKLKQEPGNEITEISENDQNVPSTWDKKQEPVTEETLPPLPVQHTPPMDTRKLRTPPLSTNTGETQDTALGSKIRPQNNNPSTEEYNDSSELNSNLKYEFISHEFKLPHPHIRPGKALSLENDEDNQEINSLSMLEPTAGQPRPPRVSHRKPEQHPRRNQLNTETSSITDDINSYLNNNQGDDSSGHSKQILPADDSSKQESKDFIQKVKGFFTFGKKSKPTIEPREKTRHSPMRPSRNQQKTSTEMLNQLPERPVHRKPDHPEGVEINEQQSPQNRLRPHRPQRHEFNRPATVESPVYKGNDVQKPGSGFIQSLGTFFHSKNLKKDSEEGILDGIRGTLQASSSTAFLERQSQPRPGTNSAVKPERKPRTEANVIQPSEGSRPRLRRPPSSDNQNLSNKPPIPTDSARKPVSHHKFADNKEKKKGGGFFSSLSKKMKNAIHSGPSPRSGDAYNLRTGRKGVQPARRPPQESPQKNSPGGRLHSPLAPLPKRAGPQRTLERPSRRPANGGPPRPSPRRKPAGVL